MSTPMKRTTVFDREIVSLPLKFLAGGTEVSTGFEIPTYGILYPDEMYVMVDTIDATETVDVGILSTEVGGDADGFLNDLAVGVAGLIKPAVTITQGSQVKYISATTFGILFLPAATKGADLAGQNAVPVFTPYVCDGVAKTISYTPSTSDTFVGRLLFRVHVYPF